MPRGVYNHHSHQGFQKKEISRKKIVETDSGAKKYFVKICPVCKKEFDVHTSSFKKYKKRMYCSYKCGKKAVKIKSLANRKKGIFPNIWLKLRFEVFKRDNFTCQYCGRKAPNVILQTDHILPKNKGGNNNINNLITSCEDCNLGKGDTLLSQREEKLGHRIFPYRTELKEAL